MKKRNLFMKKSAKLFKKTFKMLLTISNPYDIIDKLSQRQTTGAWKLNNIGSEINTTQDSLEVWNSKEWNSFEKKSFSSVVWGQLQTRRKVIQERGSEGSELSGDIQGRKIARIGKSISWCWETAVDIKDLTKSLILAQDERWRRA